MFREICVVLPCAGAGLRFGAPYPKELHCLSTGTTVLDLALAPVLELADRGTQVRLVAVISTAKMSTAAYLARFCGRLSVVLTYQTPEHEPGLRGALAAAVPLCTNDTVLLLPDQYYRWDPADNPVQAMLGRLDRTGWAVLAAPADDPATLAVEGALRLEPARDGEWVSAAAEKPADTTPYNAVWVAVAVSAHAVGGLPDVAAKGGQHPLVGAAAVRVGGYRNMTTPGAAA